MNRGLSWRWRRGSQKFAGLNVEHRRQTKGDGTRRGEFADLGVKLSGFLGVVRVRIFNKNIDGLAELCHGGHGITLALKDVGQEFKKGDTTGPCSQILTQQRFG
jgi:hypothetical protein